MRNPPKTIYIGNSYREFQNRKTRVVFQDHREATAAWIALANMGIPAFLTTAFDGYWPNSGLFGKNHLPADPRLVMPDIVVSPKNSNGIHQIYSRAMRCELAADDSDLFIHIASLIREYRERVEADFWEVA